MSSIFYVIQTTMDELKIQLTGIDELKTQISELKELFLFYQKNALPKYIHIDTVEEKFHISAKTLDRLAEKGKLNKYKLSDRKVYYSTQEIYTLIESNRY